MPDATIITLAKAIVTDLTGAGLSQSFTPTRAYRPVYELEDLKTLTVTVLASGWVSENRDRSNSQDTFTVDVGVQKAIDTTSNAAMDPLMYLMQQLMDRFARKNLTSPLAVCVYRVMMPGAEAGYSIEHLDQAFMGVIRTTWKVLG